MSTLPMNYRRDNPKGRLEWLFCTPTALPPVKPKLQLSQGSYPRQRVGQCQDSRPDPRPLTLAAHRGMRIAAEKSADLG